MARRLLDATHGVSAYNRTTSKLDELRAAGAQVAPARHGGVVLTMLSDDDALALICAPMLGRPETVSVGQAAVVAAGPEQAMTRCHDLFVALGRKTFNAGVDPAGAAVVKIANNFLLGCAVEAFAEAFSLVESTGVEAAAFYGVVTDGLFASPAYTIYGKLIAEKAYDQVGFAANLALKDVKLALATGEAARVPLPTASVCRDRLIGVMANGDGDRDWSVLGLEQARASGRA